ncbi:DUF4266 domain-containing protein [Methylomonas sp. AM2-LC]|uniref:DUF4266 domain-containing protein n=1 Tax=Methylomonas sp. AM2-LC TaxID=3153301 RepID=UPI0032679D16
MPNKKLPLARIFGLLCILLINLTGCTPIQPWERGNLAKPQMALDPDPLLNGMRAHNYSSREAAPGASFGSGGGGCGCN